MEFKDPRISIGGVEYDGTFSLTIEDNVAPVYGDSPKPLDFITSSASATITLPLEKYDEVVRLSSEATHYTFEMFHGSPSYARLARDASEKAVRAGRVWKAMKQAFLAEWYAHTGRGTDTEWRVTIPDCRFSTE
jgi:hypothetical protein